MTIEKLILKEKKMYYENLIKYCSKSNINSDFFEKKLSEFSQDLTITDSDVSESVNQPPIDNTKFSETNNLSETSEVTYSDDYLYMKPWTKLTSTHKIIKIKEFVSKLLINNNQDKDILKKKLVKLVNNKHLTKKDMVKYDSEKGRIIAIPILTYKNGKYMIK